MYASPAAIGRAIRIHLDKSCRDTRTQPRLLDVLRTILGVTGTRGPISLRTIARQLQRPVPHTQSLLLLLQERGETLHDERGWRRA